MAPTLDFSSSSSSISLLCCEAHVSHCFSHNFHHRLPPTPSPSPFLDILDLHDPSDSHSAFSTLLDRELFHIPSLDYSKLYTSHLLDALSRQNAIDWLFKVREFYNFSSLTAFLSVNFLDRFLSRHQLPKGRAWMTQLLSVACLSLAAKMEETDVPLLLDLQVDPGCIFEPRTIQRMELLVLSALDWRVSSVTPFSYIGYFIHKLGLIGSAHQHILCSETSEFLLSAVRDLKFFCYRPSSIAVAAVLCAMQSALPHRCSESKKALMSLLPADLITLRDAIVLCAMQSALPHRCSESKKALMSLLPADLQDHSERCYRLMADLFLKPQCLQPKDENHRTSSVPQSPIGVLDASFSTSDSESTFKSAGLDPSSQVSSPAPKKRRVDDFL